MPITLEDIARMSGVSRSTVSRVVNGDPHVNVVTRGKVQGIIRSTDFQPNLVARGLAVGAIPLMPELVAAGEFSDTSGYQAMKRLLLQCPDAVFVASDSMALAAMRAIQEEGLHIPEDIAVVGFDDIPTAATSRPPLTTVRQPIQRMGSIAVETLIDMIEHPSSQPRHIMLPVELVIRSSC